MRFMIMARATDPMEEQLAKAGVLLDAAADYTLIQTKTREEAFEWARRFPSPFGRAEGEIEVRELYEPEDFADFADAETIDRFRELPKAQ